MNWDRLPIVKLAHGVRAAFAHVFIDLPLWLMGFTECENCGRRISPREERHVESASGYDGTYEWYVCTKCEGRRSA